MPKDLFAHRRMLPSAARDSMLRMNYLYQAAYLIQSLHPDNASMTRYLVYQMKMISKRQVLRLHPSIKRNCCRYCNALMTPGISTKVRYKRRLDKVVTTTCDECGYSRTFNNRRSFRKKNEPSKDSDSEPEEMDIDEPTSPVSDMEFELPEPVHPSVPVLDDMDVNQLQNEVIFVFPSEKTMEKWSKLEEKWPKLAKLWNNVVAYPHDFEAWMEVLDLVDRKNKLSYGRVAYEEFFRLYPYCYVYWLKYADLENRNEKFDKAKEIYERAVKAIPLSCDVWLTYITFTKSRSTKSDDKETEENIRSLYERAISAAGQDYKSDALWTSYIEWETANGQAKKITEIYDRLIRLPIENYHQHFENFKKFVDENQPIEMLALDTYLKIRDALTEVMFDAKGTEEIRKQIVKNRLKQHWTTEREFQRRAAHEAEIKRPYFHVAPLKLKQLYNWNEYLDFEINSSGEHKVKLLFERCMIACAQYEDFWLKYVEWTERRGDVEGARAIFRRACTIHLTRKLRVHLAWAAFEERNGNMELAWEILKNIDIQLPGMAELAMRRVSLARRRGNHQVALRLFADYIEQTDDVPTKQFFAIKHSNYLYKYMNDKEKAVAVLQEALETDQTNERLIGAVIDLEASSDDPNDALVMTLYDRLLENASSEFGRQALIRRRFEYAEEVAATGKWILHTQFDHYFMLRDIARQKIDEKLAEVKRREENEEVEEAKPETEKKEVKESEIQEVSEEEGEMTEVADGKDVAEIPSKAADDVMKRRLSDVTDPRLRRRDSRDSRDGRRESLERRDGRDRWDSGDDREASRERTYRRERSRDDGRRPSRPVIKEDGRVISSGRTPSPELARDTIVPNDQDRWKKSIEERERQIAKSKEIEILAKKQEFDRLASREHERAKQAKKDKEERARLALLKEEEDKKAKKAMEELNKPKSEEERLALIEKRERELERRERELREWDEMRRQEAQKKRAEIVKERSMRLLALRTGSFSGTGAEEPEEMEEGEVDDVEPPPKIRAAKKEASPFTPGLPDLPPISVDSEPPPLPPGSPPPDTPPPPPSETGAGSPARPPLPPGMAPGTPPDVIKKRAPGDVYCPPAVAQLLRPPRFMLDTELPASCKFRVEPLVGLPLPLPVAGPVSKPKKAKKEKKKKEKKSKKEKRQEDSKPSISAPVPSMLEDISDEEEGEIR